MVKKPAVMILLLLLVAPCLAATLSVKAQTYALIVPDQYPTIAAALNNAHSGDTIFVRSGTYNEHLLTINCSLSLIGEGSGTTVINSLDSGYLGYWPHLYCSAPIRINANNIVISGFTLQGGMQSIYGTGDGVQIIGNVMDSALELEGSHQTIANNTVGTTATTSPAKIECTGDSNIIANNQLTFGSIVGIDVKGLNNIVYGNMIKGNAWPGIQLEYNTTGTIIAKNTLTNSSISWDNYDSSNTVCGNYIDGSISLMGFNNVFYGNTLTYVVCIGGTHGGTEDAANNLFYQNNFLVNSPPVMIFTSDPGPESWDNGNVGNYWSGITDQNGNQHYIVKTTYSNAGGAYGTIGQDNHPLLAPFDISTVQIAAPQWTKPVFNPSAYTVEPSPIPTSNPQNIPITSTEENTTSTAPLPSTPNLSGPGITQQPIIGAAGNESHWPQTALVIGVVIVSALILVALFVYRKRQA
jgi:hypothetical protein